jgi:hypothetical protein
MIAPTEKLSLDGLNINLNNLHDRNIMLNKDLKLGTVFGLCVIIVSLCSGCATQVDRVPMAAQDLNYFRIDCKRKQQQVVMLQSMRQTADEQAAAAFTNAFTPWRVITDPNGYQRRYEIGTGEINRQINYNLHLLSYC